MNKKGDMLGDTFDFIFTLIMGFFIFTFTMMVVNDSLEKRVDQTIVQTQRIQKINDYLADQRIDLENGEELQKNIIDRDITFLKKRGFIPTGGGDSPVIPYGPGKQ